MKTHTFRLIACAIALVTVFASCKKDNENDDKKPEITVPESWDAGDWGTASFATTGVWIVGSQAWSDAVTTTMTSGKTTFESKNMSEGTFLADGCSNPDRKGDLFSWEMVNQFGNVLCPEGWRVPTKGDFETLNTELGGAEFLEEDPDRDIEVVKAFISATYINSEKWGGEISGAKPAMQAPRQEGQVWFWSSTEADANSANVLRLMYREATEGSSATASIYIGNLGCMKDAGGSLRCVKDVE
ncbi:MAG: fibrobacter succinogenes major paralogous domain-containing protein [Bacteroidales bacterium]|jgi:uncharacterized protein (TIGR02145 family)|nr:fibrobacter succinogenes major paralogous domain-containing protein [Bacteroidales bacterium]